MKFIFLLILGLVLYSTTSSASDLEKQSYERKKSCVEFPFNFQKTLKIAKRPKFIHFIFPGNKHAQFHVCNMYLTGCGVEKNILEGLKWCEKASQNEIWESSLYLAGVYHNIGAYKSIGISKDYKKAAHYYELFMEQHPNNVKTYDMLGWLYEHGGYGLEKDLDKANFYKELHRKESGE